MARPLRIEFPGALYHVTSRGDERKEIFLSVRDRERFLEYLLSATQRYGAAIHCYCLMTNHYHLLMETPRGNLSQVMRHINGAYTTYFNVKRKHAGHLLQGRFRGIVVEADRYALELSRYIHLNPVRAGMVKTPDEYRWSSYCAYIGKSPRPVWLSMSLVLRTFGQNETSNAVQYQQFVEEMIGKDYPSPLDATVASTILGGDDFVETLMAEYLDSEVVPDVPAVRRLSRRFTIADIIAETEKVIGDPQLSRYVALHLCHRYSGEILRTIGSHFGVGDSGVSKASSRLQKQMEEDTGLRQMVGVIISRLGYVQVQT